MARKPTPERKATDPWARSSAMYVKMRPGERADLEDIAEAWGIKPASAAWAIIASFLAKARMRRLCDLPSARHSNADRDTREAVEAWTAYEQAEQEGTADTAGAADHAEQIGRAHV